MANKKLEGIIWPNLPNDTYILDAEKVKYDASETYPTGSAGKALQNKAEVDGSYSDLTAGNAEQLVSNVKVNDKTPYLFRTSGGSVDIGDREYVNGIIGGTVAWNQLLKNADFASGMQNWNVGGNATASVSNGVLTAVANGTPTGNQYVSQGNLALPSGHKMLWLAELASNSAQIAVQGIQSSPWTTVFTQNVSVTSTLTPKAGVVAVGSGNTVNGFFFNFDLKENVIIKSPQLFDLTQMFGSTIADYIYSLEQANAGAGVAFFKKLGFNKPYYAYNAGELKSVSGLVSHEMTGFNQWDEEWELGSINGATGAKEAGSNNTIRSKNFIPCLPNTAYYINKYNDADGIYYVYFYDADKNYLGETATSVVAPKTLLTSADSHYMMFRCYVAYGTTYKNDICINLSWDGSRNGEYEPYDKHSYPLDTDLTLRGIPKLDANNNLYYDGDVYAPSGEVQRRYAVVTSFSRGSTDSSGKLYNVSGTLSASAAGTGDRGVSNKLPCVDLNTCRTNSTNGIKSFCAYGTAIYVGGYIGEENALDSMLQNFEVIYERATPTTETADPYVGTQIVNDFGTEEYVIDSETFAVPVGHDTDYPVNLVAKLEMAPNSPDGDGDYIVRQTNGMNEYVPLVIEDALPTIPSTAGSYKLIVTVAEGSDPVLSWEAE